jgi:pyrroline-5-carboxylate reductase
VDAGVQLGFPRPVAQKLAIQTVKGSAIFAEQSGQHPAVLRNMVTSPGGTTAVALYYLEKGGLRSTVSRAVAACYESP